MKTISPTKPKLAEDETFMKLYCACLSGVASQLEQTFSNDGLPAHDIYSENLRHREQFSVARAFRMAVLAKEELLDSEFNKIV
jgi:hypothetical protein